jgi:hypothetical protein
MVGKENMKVVYYFCIHVERLREVKENLLGYPESWNKTNTV